MIKKISIIFSILFLACLLASGVVFTATPSMHLAENNPPDSQSHSDTLELPRAPSPLEQKLKDPDFDVRMPGGSRLQPWHDINSMYPRRTLQISQMA